MDSSFEDEKRYRRWANFIKNHVGDASDRILRYFWDLYSVLIDEIRTTNQNHKDNGKSQNRK